MKVAAQISLLAGLLALGVLGWVLTLDFWVASYQFDQLQRVLRISGYQSLPVAGALLSSAALSAIFASWARKFPAILLQITSLLSGVGLAMVLLSDIPGASVLASVAKASGMAGATSEVEYAYQLGYWPQTIVAFFVVVALLRLILIIRLPGRSARASKYTRSKQARSRQNEAGAASLLEPVELWDSQRGD